MITIKGSYVGNRQDTAEAIEFYRRGLIKAPVKIVGLSELQNVFDLMRKCSSVEQVRAILTASQMREKLSAGTFWIPSGSGAKRGDNWIKHYLNKHPQGGELYPSLLFFLTLLLHSRREICRKHPCLPATASTDLRLQFCTPSRSISSLSKGEDALR
jgi:hypothetical protein